MKVIDIKAVTLFCILLASFVTFTGNCWSAEAADPRKSGNTKGVDYSVILKRNLFDALSDSYVEGKEIEPDILENTKLDIVLMGTIQGGAAARAIILDKKDRTQNLYQVGDYVKGALIKRITRKNVILNHNGENQNLNMNEAYKYVPRMDVKPVVASPVAGEKRSVKKVKNVPVRRTTSNSNGSEG